jgi:hypothetical protein
MSSATPRVDAKVETNISTRERTPRLVMVVAAGVAAAFAPSIALKGLLLGSAAAMLATVATGYCPINAALVRGGANAPGWRTLRTHRVEP